MKAYQVRLIVVVVLVHLAFFPILGEAQKKPFRVGYNQWIGLAGVFIAQDKGFFEKRGLSVELVPFSGPADTLPPLIAGHLDVGLTTMDNLILLSDTESGSMVSVGFTDTSYGADALVARKEIASIGDLKGKQVAATLGQVNHLLLLLALKGAGLKEADVNIVNMNADDAGAAFIAGQLDAAATWEPWVSKATSQGSGRVIFSSREVPNVILDGIAVSKKTLEERPEEIRIFLEEIGNGAQYLQKNPGESAEITAKWLNVKPAEVEDMLKGVQIFNFRDNQRIFGSPDKPGPAYKAMEIVADFLLAQKIIKKPANIPSLLDPRFVQPK